MTDLKILWRNSRCPVCTKVMDQHRPVRLYPPPTSDGNHVRVMCKMCLRQQTDMDRDAALQPLEFEDQTMTREAPQDPTKGLRRWL